MYDICSVLRRLGTSLANQRATLSSELGSLWELFKIDKERRRSAPTTYEPIQTDAKSPVKLARDLLQVVQETVFAKKFEDKRCPLVKEESDLTSSDEEEGDRRIANLIEFFFTIVKSQKGERKGSGGSCFKTEISPTEDKITPYTPIKVNTELEQKMETLIEFLASTGCIDDEFKKEDKKITLMEFLFGADDRIKPIVEINVQQDYNKGISLSETNVNCKDLSYIDETPVEEGTETLVELLMKYMDNYSPKEKIKSAKSMSLTPPLSEKSKSDITISRLETYSDISKTKSDSTLHTQDTVIDRYEDMKSDKSRRISETVVDLSNVKQDLEDIFEVAIAKVREITKITSVDDTMSVQEDLENFNSYTKPEYVQYLPYSVDLSDILEEDESSSRDFERMTEKERYDYAKRLAENILDYIDDKIQPCYESDSDEFDYSYRRVSISLIDLRNIPDLPPSMIIKPIVKKVDKATSTTEISDSNSDLSRRIDSASMTEDTSLSNSSEQRALDKLESLTRFFSRESRLEIIDESLEDGARTPKYNQESRKSSEPFKEGQASLDDVEDIQDDVFVTNDDVVNDNEFFAEFDKAKFDDCQEKGDNDVSKDKWVTDDK